MKERFFSAVVDHRKPIIAVFLILSIIAAFLKPMVGVNYDMSDYLPKDSPSTVSLDVMKEEFDGEIPNARVMVKDVTVPEALAYKEKLETIDGILEVTWLDDAGNIDAPLETRDPDTVEDYYKDGNALFTVTIDEEKELTAVDDIREVIGEDNAMTGSAVETAIATKSTVKEIRVITVFAVIFVLLILILTTKSWLEPLWVFLGLGVAILINGGSNLIFGEISFVTNAAGSILQLAISLDFSVFLLHRYYECRGKYGNPAEDMKAALSRAGTAVFSSAVTVMIGFLALSVMRFGIGPDLGLALAKGICISLITVFLFTPGLLVSTEKHTQKFMHRPLLPDFRKLGEAVTRWMIPLACLMLILPVPCFIASNSNDYYYGTSHIFGEGTEAGNDTAAVEAVFGKRDTYVLLVPNGSPATENALSKEIQSLPEVSSMISYTDTVDETIPQEFLDEDTRSLLISDDYSRMVIGVNAEYEGDKTFALVEKIRNIAQSYYPDEYRLAGEGVSTYDLMDTISADRVKVELIAVGAVILVLLLALRSVSLPVILVLVIETSIWLNLSIPYVTGNTIFYIAYLIISTIQLGISVDYAILFTDRYKEFRRTEPKRQAITDTVAATFVPITTSGIAITVVGTIMGIVSSHGILSQLGFFLGRGTFCSLVAVIFILPGMLCIFDKLIEKTTLNTHFYHEPKGGLHP